MRGDAKLRGSLKGDVAVVIRLVHDVNERRPGVGAHGLPAVAAGTAPLVEPLALGQLHRSRPGIEFGAHLGPILARGEQRPGKQEGRSGRPHESCPASRSRASMIMARTRSFRAGTSDGVSPEVSTGGSTSTTAVDWPKRQSCLGSAFPV